MNYLEKSLLTLIEIDRDLIKYLSQKYLFNKKVNLINADIQIMKLKTIIN